jgi:hypothetical protein
MVANNKSKGRRRLLALANFLIEKAPELKGKFSMLTWGKPKVRPEHRREFKATCGTSACALGWGTAVPALRRAGLRAFVSPQGKYATMAVVNERDEVLVASSFTGKSIDDLCGMFFGIAAPRAEHMFYPTGADGNTQRLTAERAGKRIKATIAQIDENEGWLV